MGRVSSPRALYAAAQRQVAREREKRDAAERQARVDKVVARILRRCPAVDRGEAAYAATRILFGQAGDALATRSPPETYRGWREDGRRRMAYFGILREGPGYGIPLAHEGGAPLRCIDKVTADRSMANYRAARAA